MDRPFSRRVADWRGLISLDIGEEKDAVLAPAFG